MESRFLNGLAASVRQAARELGVSEQDPVIRSLLARIDAERKHDVRSVEQPADDPEARDGCFTGEYNSTRC